MRCSYSRPFHRSYQTNTGVVSGVQWVPAEATSVMPTGAQPANNVRCSTLCPVIPDNRANQSIRTSCHPGIEIEMTRQRGNGTWPCFCLTSPIPDIISWRVRRQKDEEYRIRKEEKEAAKRLKKDRERRATEARGPPGSPYGAYTNPMNDLERRMDGVDLNRGRGASVGEYNRRQTVTPCTEGTYLSLPFTVTFTVRIAISTPDRASIAQHGCNQSRLPPCPSGRVSPVKPRVSAVGAWP